jgi:putative endonuclease
MYFVYILKCGDGSYYVGSTQDVASRIALHNSGMGPIHTAARLPVTLIYQEEFSTLAEAVRRERQLKAGRAQKRTRSSVAINNSSKNYRNLFSLIQSNVSVRTPQRSAGKPESH